MDANTNPDKLPSVEAKGLDNSASVVKEVDGDTIIKQQDGETIVIDRKAERKLLWKFDSRILPLLAMMYLFNSLDKSNLGNAKTAGLEKSLGMAGTNHCK